MSSGASLIPGSVDVVYYSGNRKTGELRLLRFKPEKYEIIEIPNAKAGDQAASEKPILLGVSEQAKAVLMDPVSKAISVAESFPIDAFPAHVYYNPYDGMAWYMNDGDKATGNDTLNCADQGSSVTIVDSPNSGQARYVKTICVGRGHHQACFTAPCDQQQDMPKRAYISNLIDGSISVIDTDPASTHYLALIATINLYNPNHEKMPLDSDTPNNAFPHGLAYSNVSGKLYCLNNGYGHVVVIDPVSLAIEKEFALKGYSNLFAAPDGRHLIGRGADRKSDDKHVIANICKIDTATDSIVEEVKLNDFYLSKYYFTPDGATMLMTTGASGNDEQKANLKTEILLSFPVSASAKMADYQQISVGSAGSIDFTVDDQGKTWIFCSDAEHGHLVVIQQESGLIADRIKLHEPMSHARVWCL